MAFNGSGTFQPLAAPTFPAVAGATILAARFNSNITDIHTGLTNCVTRDGQSPALANLPMAGFKHTGLGAGSTAGDSVRYEQAVLVQQELTGAADLNTLTSPGTYVFSSYITSGVTNGPNTTYAGRVPADNNASLLVVKGSSASSKLTQVLTGAIGDVYVRQYTAGWGQWYAVDNVGSSYTSGQDFNTKTVAGTYHFSSAAMSASTNRPSEYVNIASVSLAVAGTLVVQTFLATNQVIQTVTTATGRVYTRLYTGSWSSWTVSTPTQQGTYTPTLSGAGGTITITGSSATYCTMGPLTYVNGVIVWTSNAMTGDVKISLPVNTSTNQENYPFQVYVPDFTGANVGNIMGITLTSDNANVYLQILNSSSQNIVDLDGTNLPAAGSLTFQGFYVNGT